MENMFTFVSGNLALDFAGTVRARTTDRDDQLATPSDLGRWLVEAGVLDTVPDCVATDLGHAVRLREAGYGLALAALRREPFDEADRAVVNRAALGELPNVDLLADGTVRRTGSVDAALATIARAAIEVVGGADHGQIRECGRDACTRLYLDTSRARNRRWCDMTRCGNRAKSAAFRTRHSEK